MEGTIRGNFARRKSIMIFIVILVLPNFILLIKDSDALTLNDNTPLIFQY